jgi:hypothetical protein
MMMDFDPEVTGLSSQPFWLHWHDGRRPRKHAPDFFDRLADGTGVGHPASVRRSSTGRLLAAALAAPGLERLDDHGSAALPGDGPARPPDAAALPPDAAALPPDESGAGVVRCAKNSHPSTGRVRLCGRKAWYVLFRVGLSGPAFRRADAFGRSG